MNSKFEPPMICKLFVQSVARSWISPLNAWKSSRNGNLEMMKRQSATFVASSRNSQFSMTKPDPMLTTCWNNCRTVTTRPRKYYALISQNVLTQRSLTRMNAVGPSVDSFALNRPTCNWFATAPRKIKNVEDWNKNDSIYKDKIYKLPYFLRLLYF